MNQEEYKEWKKERQKEIKPQKQPNKRMFTSKATRESRKIAKYGIYKLTGQLSGSFGSKNS